MTSQQHLIHEYTSALNARNESNQKLESAISALNAELAIPTGNHALKQSEYMDAFNLATDNSIKLDQIKQTMRRFAT